MNSHSMLIGTAEVQVPGYMCSLPQESIDRIIIEESLGMKVISCGVNPRDGCLYMITATCDIKRIRPNGRIRPAWARPVNSEVIELGFDHISRIILSDLAIKNSEDCMNMSQLYVNNNYMCDIELSGFQVAQVNDET